MMAETGCDGVVVGRGCLGRPWLFRDLSLAFAGEPVPPPPALGEVAAVLAEHARMLMEWFGEAHGCRELRKHASWYLKGYAVGTATSGRALASVASPAELDDLLGSLPPDLPAHPGRDAWCEGTRTGPGRVVLPEGWLDHPDDASPPAAAAGLVVSGG